MLPTAAIVSFHVDNDGQMSVQNLDLQMHKFFQTKYEAISSLEPVANAFVEKQNQHFVLEKADVSCLKTLPDGFNFVQKEDSNERVAVWLKYSKPGRIYGKSHKSKRIRLFVVLATTETIAEKPVVVVEKQETPVKTAEPVLSFEQQRDASYCKLIAELEQVLKERELRKQQQQKQEQELLFVEPLEHESFMTSEMSVPSTPDNTMQTSSEVETPTTESTFPEWRYSSSDDMSLSSEDYIYEMPAKKRRVRFEDEISSEEEEEISYSSSTEDEEQYFFIGPTDGYVPFEDSQPEVKWFTFSAQPEPTYFKQYAQEEPQFHWETLPYDQSFQDMLAPLLPKTPEEQMDEQDMFYSPWQTTTPLAPCQRQQPFFRDW